MPKLPLIIICLLLVLLIGFFLIWPKYQELTNLSREIEAKETELQYTQEHFSNLKKISEELKKYEDQISKIDFTLPSNVSLTSLSLINFLQKTSPQNGLIFKKLGSLSVTSPKITTTAGVPKTKPSSKIKEIHLSFEVVGSYPALKNFLDSLEKSAKLIEVDNISFSFEEGEVFSFSFKIKTYSY